MCGCRLAPHARSVCPAAEVVFRSWQSVAGRRKVAKRARNRHCKFSRDAHDLVRAHGPNPTASAQVALAFVSTHISWAADRCVCICIQLQTKLLQTLRAFRLKALCSRSAHPPVCAAGMSMVFHWLHGVLNDISISCERSQHRLQSCRCEVSPSRRWHSAERGAMPPLKGAKRGRPRKFPEGADAEPGAKWQKLLDGRSGSSVGDAEQGGGAWADSPALAGGRAPPANGRKSRAAPHAATAAAAAAVIAQQSGAKRPPGRPRKHPLPVAATTPAPPSPADGSPWNQLHLLAPQSSGDEDSPQVGASRESSHGTPAGAGPLLRREDSFAGTAASGDLAGRGVGVGDARRRSRKASAPRRQVRRFPNVQLLFLLFRLLSYCPARQSEQSHESP